MNTKAMTARALLEVADEMRDELQQSQHVVEVSIEAFRDWHDRIRALTGSIEYRADQPTIEMAAAFKAAHDEHAAAHIPKIYAKGQREEANIIVGLRAALAVQPIASSLAEQPAKGECTLGVGDGSGNLFVHGSYDAIKACQALILRAQTPQPSDPADAEDFDNSSITFAEVCELAHGTQPTAQRHDEEDDPHAWDAIASDPYAQHGTEAGIGAAFLRVLGDPAIKWRETGAKPFIDRVAHEAAAHGAGAAVEAVALESKLAQAGVFKGAEGLRRLYEAGEFWDRQPYSTRLYFGDGIADYLHRSVLGAAIKLLDESPQQRSEQAVEATHTTQDDYEHFLSYSGLDDNCWLRYAYFHGADDGIDRPDLPPKVQRFDKREYDHSIELYEDGYYVRHDNYLTALYTSPQQRNEQGDVIGYVVEKKRHVVSDGPQRQFYFADEQDPTAKNWWIKGEQNKYTVTPVCAALSTQPLLSDQHAGVSEGDDLVKAEERRLKKMEAYWKAYCENRGHGEGEAILAGLQAYQAALHPEQAKDGAAG